MIRNYFIFFLLHTTHGMTIYTLHLSHLLEYFLIYYYLVNKFIMFFFIKVLFTTFTVTMFLMPGRRVFNSCIYFVNHIFEKLFKFVYQLVFIVFVSFPGWIDITTFWSKYSALECLSLFLFLIFLITIFLKFFSRIHWLLFHFEIINVLIRSTLFEFI